AVTRLVIEAPPGVEALGQKGDSAFLCQQRIAEGEQGVHGVTRRPPGPCLEAPFGIEVPGAEQGSKLPEVLGRDRALETEEFPRRAGAPDLAEQRTHLGEHPIRSRTGVSAENGALVDALRQYDSLCDSEAAVRI